MLSIVATQQPRDSPLGLADGVLADFSLSSHLASWTGSALAVLPLAQRWEEFDGTYYYVCTGRRCCSRYAVRSSQVVLKVYSTVWNGLFFAWRRVPVEPHVDGAEKGVRCTMYQPCSRPAYECAWVLTWRKSARSDPHQHASTCIILCSLPS